MNDKRYAVLKEIIKIYLPEDVPVEDIRAESHFIEELNINSANLVDIVLDVEDAFDIMIKDDDIEQMKTVSDALRIVDKKLLENAGSKKDRK